ncbi:peptide chain release factor N(5)-glutamine methyltransferase [Tahibacter soli]|uniref:Release factor glutamine methyltransferase n=1 Tax=Tahibacter soli TaxID=2983605 RepID=A0A9X3YHT0_9GAMM|nr:peptide chain release factor N(5)-glutamine methyltransferase [Tahibacter soli]MDC8011266.1 peptide chain release factor N(5)-glutamine methyltransferase [Tahibacter soli]
MSIRAALRDAAARLPGEGARLDAEVLLLHVLGRSRAWLFAHGDDALDPAHALALDALVSRRALGVPVAHLTGTREFWSMTLKVTPDTLIPRPETELLVELALARIAPDASCAVADLGTGTGAVALALARERPRARVVATDISAAALSVARENAKELKISNVDFALGDWCGALGDLRCDVIASNPPYIERTDAHLEQGDLRYEPIAALASGDDGLDAIRAIATQSPEHLRPGGWLLLEHGWMQGEAVRKILIERAFVDVQTWRDLEDRDRVTGGRRT